ncbi:MAG: hypothetical protein HFE73_07665 [Firmicutes bacterium]|nr:hypothetical protein [Bacillota bacterium]
MKTIFIINPCAGQGRGIDQLKQQIKKAIEETGQTASIYMTKEPGDGEEVAKIFTYLTCGSEEGRIIACGGDGTLNEILNGVLSAPPSDHMAIGLMPTGTGNDFARNFPDAGDFLDPKAQLLGEIIDCDAIRYWGDIDGKQQTRYCANMFNIGFDCNVVDMAARLKNYPLVAGSFAYLLAVAVTFIKKKGARLKVELDGEVIEDGSVLLTALGNGGFCGGGVHSSPYASVQDGKMDVNIIYNVGRLDFLKKFPYYAKGTHNELPDIDRILCARTCQTARITPLDGVMRLCTDGEIVDAGTVDFAVEQGAFRLLLPRKI